MKSKYQSALPLLSYFVTFLIIYSPTILIDYVHHDGVLFFLRTPGTLEPNFHQSTAIAIGRYLAGYYLSFIGWMIDTVSDIKYIRLFNILLMSQCAALIHEWFSLQKIRHIHSYCIIVMIFTLASFQSLFSYSGNFPFLPALLFSILSAKCILRIPEDDTLAASISSPFRWFAAGLLLCALCFYPSLAMYYWFLAAIILIYSPEVDWDIKQQRLLAFLSTGMLAMFFYAVLLKGIRKILNIALSAKSLYNPYSVTRDPIGKIKWFLTEPLFDAMNLWSIFPKSAVAFLVGFFLVTALLIHQRRISVSNVTEPPNKNIANNLIVLVWFCLLLVLSYFPNLVAVGNAPWYRTQAALGSIVLLAIVWSVQQWISLLPNPLRSKVLTFCLVVGATSGAMFAYHNVLTYRVLPSYNEYQYIRHILNQSAIHPDQRIHVILPPEKPKHARYDEFGVISSHYRTDLDSLIIGIFRDLDREEDILKYGVWRTDSYFDEPYKIDSSTILIDTRILQY